MLIKDPPVEITANLSIIASEEYPLYLVKGKREIAIFEGGTGAMGPLVAEQLQQLGVDSEAVKQVIVPHAHPDHVMAIPAFRQIFPQAAVLASAAAAGTLAAEKAIALFCKIDGAITEGLLKVGMIAERHRPRPLAENRIAVDRLIKEADTVVVDGISFDVLETPGHSDCSLSFHEPAGRVLIVSDAVPYYMPEHDCWWPCYFTGHQAYLDSMRRLAALDAEILCLGHKGAIKGAAEIKSYFDEVIAATQQYHQRIVEGVKAGTPPRQIAEQLGSEICDKTQFLPLDFFQKNCWLLVKQSLKHEGISLT